MKITKSRTTCGICGHHKSIHKYVPHPDGRTNQGPQHCGVPGCPCATYVQLGKGERRRKNGKIKQYVLAPDSMYNRAEVGRVFHADRITHSLRGGKGSRRLGGAYLPVGWWMIEKVTPTGIYVARTGSAYPALAHEAMSPTSRRNPRPTKFEYLYVLQGYYAHGWEDLTAEKKQGAGVDLPAMRRLRAEKKNYQQNEGGQYRIVERREKIESGG